jgi:hypothetical protein
MTVKEDELMNLDRSQSSDFYKIDITKYDWKFRLLQQIVN